MATSLFLEKEVYSLCSYGSESVTRTAVRQPGTCTSSVYVHVCVHVHVYINFLYIIEMSVFSVGKLTLAIENVHIRMNVTSLCTARLCHGLAVHSDVTFTTG